jgi:excinuclease ABC subunit A
VTTGNTVIVIEHNLDVLKTADWIVDLGPEGGARGGRIVAEGTPEAVAQVAGSATGEYLARVLRGEPIVPLSGVTFRGGGPDGGGDVGTAVATGSAAGPPGGRRRRRSAGAPTEDGSTGRARQVRAVSSGTA